MKTSSNAGTRVAVALGLLAGFPACGTGGDSGTAGPEEPGAPAEEIAPMVAALTFDSGQVVEVYDMGRDGAFVTETGPAGAHPILNQYRNEMGADQLVSLWGKPAPNQAVPAKLRGLQDRLMQPAAPGQTSRRLPAAVRPDLGGGTSLDNTPIDAPEGTLAAPEGCNNGCCDYQWLDTAFLACDGGGDSEWFYFNYGWSWAKRSDALIYEGLACAAIGTSSFRLEIEGKSVKTWSVPEATYRWYRNIAPVCCNDPNIYARVNTSSTMHTHAHCGVVWY